MTAIEMILSLSAEEQYALITGPHSEWCPDENCWMPLDEKLAWCELIAMNKIYASMCDRLNYSKRYDYTVYAEVNKAIKYLRKEDLKYEK